MKKLNFGFGTWAIAGWTAFVVILGLAGTNDAEGSFYWVESGLIGAVLAFFGFISVSSARQRKRARTYSGKILWGGLEAVGLFFIGYVIFRTLRDNSPALPLAANIALGMAVTAVATWLRAVLGRETAPGGQVGNAVCVAIIILMVISAIPNFMSILIRGTIIRAVIPLGQGYVATVIGNDSGPFRHRMSIALGKRFLFWRYATERVMYCSSLGALPTPKITLSTSGSVVISGAKFCADIIHSGKEGNGSDFATGATEYDGIGIKILKE